MKTTKQKSAWCLLLLLGFAGSTLLSCKKEKTVIAPIAHSEWITPNAYIKTTIFGTIHFTYDIAAPEITADVLNNATVLVYGRLSGYSETIWPKNQVSSMPIVLNYMQGAAQIDTWSALANEGKIRIDMTNSTNLYGSIAVTHSFRYVVIPKKMTASTVNFNDYQAVQQAFGLGN